MHLKKENIHQSVKKSEVVSQITIDEDYNLSDTKPDIGKIVLQKGKIDLEEAKALENKVYVKGTLEFSILYMGEKEGSLHNFTGKTAFSDTVNVEGVKNGDTVSVTWELEDLTISLINSRKLSIQAIVTFFVQVEELSDLQVPIGIEEDAQAEVLKDEVTTLKMIMSKKDTYRFRTELAIPSNKPNIQTVLWKAMELRGLDIRVCDEKLCFKGELLLFLLYEGEEEKGTVSWVEMSVPMNGEMECEGAVDGMPAKIEVMSMKKMLEVKPDSDGEERALLAELVLELNMKLFEEKKISYIKDLYALDRHLVPKLVPVMWEKLLVQNHAKCKAVEKLKLTEGDGKILQICHSQGNVRTDRVEIQEEGILVEGIVEVEILYISAEDGSPFNVVKGIISFSQVVEVPEIHKNCRFYLTKSLEQLSTMMLSSDEIELKAVIDLNVLVLEQKEGELMEEVLEEPFDLEKMHNLPGMTGYIVQEGDCLWDIAKDAKTTRMTIKETNQLVKDDLVPGMKLIITKAFA